MERCLNEGVNLLTNHVGLINRK